MKNNTLSGKIKELRIRKGFSQERLAQESGLSLRTIQRIENGETTPYGDTLKKLATSLNSSIEALTASKQSINRGLLPLINFSTLSFILFPPFGIIVPLVVWIRERKTTTDEWLNEVKKIINFQVSWCLLIGIAYLMLFIDIPLLHFKFIGRPELFLLSISILYLMNFVFIIMNILFSLNSKKVFYPPALKFVR